MQEGLDILSRAGQAGPLDLTAYENPYTQQVIDQSLDDISRAADMAQIQNAAAATQANAFGGARHGIVEAETNRAAIDQAARTAANLRSQGFESASARAAQDMARQMSAAGQMANMGGLLRGLQYDDAGRLTAIGEGQTAAAQATMDDMFRRYVASQQWPFQMFDVLRSGGGLLPSPVGQRQKSKGTQLGLIS